MNLNRVCTPVVSSHGLTNALIKFTGGSSRVFCMQTEHALEKCLCTGHGVSVVQCTLRQHSDLIRCVKCTFVARPDKRPSTTEPTPCVNKTVFLSGKGKKYERHAILGSYGTKTQHSQSVPKSRFPGSSGQSQHGCLQAGSRGPRNEISVGRTAVQLTVCSSRLDLALEKVSKGSLRRCLQLFDRSEAVRCCCIFCINTGLNLGLS